MSCYGKYEAWTSQLQRKENKAKEPPQEVDEISNNKFSPTDSTNDIKFQYVQYTSGYDRDVVKEATIFTLQDSFIRKGIQK